jgi:hypothetical protein
MAQHNERSLVGKEGSITWRYFFPSLWWVNMVLLQVMGVLLYKV